ncbi:MAG: hypothetical protein AAGC64_08635 [Bacteroidota bacterium]
MFWESLNQRCLVSRSSFSKEASESLVRLADHYYEKYCLRHCDAAEPVASPDSIPPLPERAEFHQVDLKGVEIEDVRTFGVEHLCQQVLDKLELKHFLMGLRLEGELDKQALIGIAVRAIFSSFEHKTAQYLKTNSELLHCFQVRKVPYSQTIT